MTVIPKTIFCEADGLGRHFFFLITKCYVFFILSVTKIKYIFMVSVTKIHNETFFVGESICLLYWNLLYMFFFVLHNVTFYYIFHEIHYILFYATYVHWIFFLSVHFWCHDLWYLSRNSYSSGTNKWNV